MLEDTLWPNLWDGYFTSDTVHADLHLDSGDAEWWQTDLQDAAAGIETWAYQPLPSAGMLPTPPDSTETGVSFEDPLAESSEQLCYGMVGIPSVESILPKFLDH